MTHPNVGKVNSNRVYSQGKLGHCEVEVYMHSFLLWLANNEISAEDKVVSHFIPVRCHPCSQ